MMNRTWSREEVEQAVPWLKRMNALGHHIYVRPAELEPGRAQGIVLVDDLKRAALQRMSRDGLEPSLVLETSRDNFQAWVRVQENSISRDEAATLARELASRYQGDRSSADARHYGRLAGFTNQKEKHLRPDGLKPFVRIVEAVQRVATKGAELLQRVREYLAEREKERRIEHIREYKPHPDWRREASPTELYRREAQRLLEQPPLKPDGSIDYSRVDFGVAMELGRGHHSRDFIREALREGSPDLAGRKAAHLENYLNRTVDRAMDELTRSRQLERKHGRGLSL